MCGRYVLRSSLPAIAEAFGLPHAPQVPSGSKAGAAGPRYNIAPGTDILAVGLREGARTVRALRWGLVPSWAKDASIGNRLVNARAEGIESKPSFRGAIRKRRVLVPADLYYEWQAPAPGERTKQPWCFGRRDGKMLAFAGLWEFWRPPEADPDDPHGDGLRTGCLITTAPNAEAARVHDRMPVVLDEQAWTRWLDPDTPLPEVLALLRPLPDGTLETWPVSRAVSRVANEGPQLVEPVELTAAGGPSN